MRCLRQPSDFHRSQSKFTFRLAVHRATKDYCSCSQLHLDNLPAARLTSERLREVVSSTLGTTFLAVKCLMPLRKPCLVSLESPYPVWSIQTAYIDTQQRSWSSRFRSSSSGSRNQPVRASESSADFRRLPSLRMHRGVLW